jgi:hypothetical protein
MKNALVIIISFVLVSSSFAQEVPNKEDLTHYALSSDEASKKTLQEKDVKEKFHKNISADNEKSPVLGGVAFCYYTRCRRVLRKELSEGSNIFSRRSRYVDRIYNISKQRKYSDRFLSGLCKPKLERQKICNSGLEIRQEQQV